MHYKRFILIWGVFLILTGCVKEDFTKFDRTIVLRPNVSVPVGLQTTLVDYPNPTSSTEITITDTISYDFADLFKTPEYIESIMFRVQTINSYPAHATIEALYMDNAGTILGSITKNAPIEITCKAVFPNEGRTEEGIVVNDYPFDTNEFQILQQGKKVLITIHLTDFVDSPELAANWANFSLTTTVGLQVQINKVTN